MLYFDRIDVSEGTDVNKMCIKRVSLFFAIGIS